MTNIMDYRIKLFNYFSEHSRGFILSLLVAVYTVYLPFLGNPLIFDDLRFFTGTVGNYKDSLFHFELRWIHYASLAWTWTHFGDVPHLHRLINITLHAINVVLLFFWLRQITMLAASDRSSPDAKMSFLNWGAWLGALFFACHPVTVYAVGYIVQRSILLATLFTLAMQLTYMRGLVSEQKLKQKLWLTLSVLFYFFAVFSKEHSIMAPALTIATTFLLRPRIHANIRTLWATWVCYLAVGIVAVLCIKVGLGTVYEHDAPVLLEQQNIVSSNGNLHLLSIITQAGLFFKYLVLWLLPNPACMSIDMREPFVQSPAWRSWMPTVCFILYGLTALRLLLCRGRLGLAGLALLYPWLFFMVEFSTIRVQETFVLYRSYLWLPGMMLLFPLLLSILPNRKITTMALTALILVLVPLSWNRLWTFADNYRLWNDAALLLPNEHASGAARIYYNRGIAEIETKRWDEAIADFERVITINPKIAQAYNSLGTAYSGLERYQEAIRKFDQAIVLNPNYANAYYGKGLTLLRMHLSKEAMTSMKKSCELKNSTACVLVAFSNSGKKH